jgi:hypothetical protein
MGIRLSLLTWAGRILNLAGFPGWIRSGSHESEFGTVQVRVSALYTVVTVNGVDVFFYRLESTASVSVKRRITQRPEFQQ